MAKTYTVGGLTMFTAGYSDELVEEMKQREIDRQLSAAEDAYTHGHLDGLADALGLLCAHHRDWPDWVKVAAAAEVEKVVFPDAAPPMAARKGRHARAETKRRSDAIDMIRATFVDCAMICGATPNAAYTVVSQQIAGDVAGDKKVMEAAWKRFHQRNKTDPHRYYHLRDWRGHLLLNALLPPSNDEK